MLLNPGLDVGRLVANGASDTDLDRSRAGACRDLQVAARGEAKDRLDLCPCQEAKFMVSFIVVHHFSCSCVGKRQASSGRRSVHQVASSCTASNPMIFFTVQRGALPDNNPSDLVGLPNGRLDDPSDC